MTGIQLRRVNLYITLTILYFLYFSIPKSHSQGRYCNIPKKTKIGNIQIFLDGDRERRMRDYLNQLNEHFIIVESHIPILLPYLDIVDSILVAHQIPSDFKYLAIQKISFSPLDVIKEDGFWDMREAKEEINFEYNDLIDEKANLIMSTEKIAKRLKENNAIYKNWFFTMLSIVMTEKKAKNFIENNYKKARVVGNTLEIQEIHNYTLNFIAYKIFFETNFGNKARKYKPQVIYKKNINIKHITRDYNINEVDFKLHNQWLKTDKINLDKKYPILILTENNVIEKKKLRPEIKPILPEITEEEKDYSNDKIVKEIDNNKIKGEEGQAQSDKDKVIEDNPIPIPQPSKKKTTVLPQPKKIYKPSSYTIRRGDNLYQISRKFGVSVNKIRVWNDIPTNNLIYPSQNLTLKEPYKIKHTVRQGENLYRITQLFNRINIPITIRNIMDWNKLNSSLIRLGQVLTIYNPNVRPTLQSRNSAGDKGKLKNKPQIKIQDTNSQKNLENKPQKRKIDLNLDKKLMSVEKAKELIRDRKK